MASGGGPQRWICWPTPDKVCIQGGCGYCNPFHCACGKRHQGSRRVTERQVLTIVKRAGIDLGPDPWSEVEEGMARQPVTAWQRKHLVLYADHSKD